MSRVLDEVARGLMFANSLALLLCFVKTPQSEHLLSVADGRPFLAAMALDHHYTLDDLAFDIEKVPAPDAVETLKTGSVIMSRFRHASSP